MASYPPVVQKDNASETSETSLGEDEEETSSSSDSDALGNVLATIKLPTPSDSEDEDDDEDEELDSSESEDEVPTTTSSIMDQIRARRAMVAMGKVPIITPAVIAAMVKPPSTAAVPPIQPPRLTLNILSKTTPAQITPLQLKPPSPKINIVSQPPIIKPSSPKLNIVSQPILPSPMAIKPPSPRLVIGGVAPSITPIILLPRITVGVTPPVTSVLPPPKITSVLPPPKITSVLPPIAPIKTISLTPILPRPGPVPAEIETLISQMPGITISGSGKVTGSVVADIDDLLQKESDETDADFQTRTTLSHKLASLPNYPLNKATAVTIGALMMKKSRLGLTYDANVENALLYLGTHLAATNSPSVSEAVVPAF